VKVKIPELREIKTDTYWDASDALQFEKTCQSLRGIMKFVQNETPHIHYTNFADDVVFREEGRDINFAKSDFDDYKRKVKRFVEKNRNNATIHKLLYNEPITAADYKELERIFTEELGTKEDYVGSYQDTPFGLLIRKIAKMNREAAMAAFGSFIAEECPNAEQIAFIEKVVDHLVENGCVNNVRDLMSAPFDRPIKFSVLFTQEEQKKMVQIINQIKENALVA